MGRGRGGSSRRHDTWKTERIARDQEAEQMRGVRGATEAVISGAIALTGAIADPAQNSDTTRSAYLESSEQRRSDDRSQHLDEGTRDAGNRNQWSSQD